MSHESKLKAQETATAALATAKQAAEPKRVKPDPDVARDALLRHLAAQSIKHDQSLHGPNTDPVLAQLLDDLPETVKAKEARVATEQRDKQVVDLASKQAHEEAKAADKADKAHAKS